MLQTYMMGMVKASVTSSGGKLKSLDHIEHPGFFIDCKKY